MYLYMYMYPGEKEDWIRIDPPEGRGPPLQHPSAMRAEPVSSILHSESFWMQAIQRLVAIDISDHGDHVR